MDKRYQVFVSSTYEDLQPERQEVMHALLELGCIPAGMELFPAANEDQWTLIKQFIDDCDYYIVIVAGRYGSVGPEGTSYTEMEYRYAVDTGIPVIAFLHKDPDSLPAKFTERDETKREKLAEFRRLLESKACKYWMSSAELGSVVSRSLIRLIRTHPAVGWVRADQLPSEETTGEILRLRRRIDELETELAVIRASPPEGTDDLAQGEDQLELNFTFWADRKKFQSKLSTTWNEVFAAVAPTMIDEASEKNLEKALNAFICERARPTIEDDSFASMDPYGCSVEESDFYTLKIQLRALGLITQGTKKRSVKDRSRYWTLTPYGDNLMTKLRAIRRSQATGKAG